jgi:hypothetical protein
MVKNALIAIALLAAVAWGQPIAHDEDGFLVAVELHEKYGPVVHDTGTVVSIWNGCFVVTHYNRPVTLYPIANYSVSKITKLNIWSSK